MRSRSHREGSRTQLADPAPMAATGAAADVDVRLAPDDVGRLCGIRTSVVVGQASPLVTGLQPRDCKSIAKASTVRIPRLPPRAKRALDAETRFGGPLRIPRGGIVTALLGDRQGRGSQPPSGMTCVAASRRVTVEASRSCGRSMNCSSCFSGGVCWYPNARRVHAGRLGHCRARVRSAPRSTLAQMADLGGASRWTGRVLDLDVTTPDRRAGWIRASCW
jgi:hypothetical protein